jgi:hypothetical protein
MKPAFSRGGFFFLMTREEIGNKLNDYRQESRQLCIFDEFN